MFGRKKGFEVKHDWSVLPLGCHARATRIARIQRSKGRLARGRCRKDVHLKLSTENTHNSTIHQKIEKELLCVFNEITYHDFYALLSYVLEYYSVRTHADLVNLR